MLTKATIQLVRSLDTRKGRKRESCFVAEGPRLVGELLGHFRCRALMATADWLAANDDISFAAGQGREVDNRLKDTKIEPLTQAELERVSLQQTPNQVLAIFEIPDDKMPEPQSLKGLHIALDEVQDPGNLGTIIRLADWFGVEHIWCSQTTADVWNPKVVQASMGGLARVRVHYINLPSFLGQLPASMNVYGTSLDGQSLWAQEFSDDAVVVMGNEGNGVSPEVAAICSHNLFIPNYPPGRATTESLNVAMATGIVLSEFRRRVM